MGSGNGGPGGVVRAVAGGGLTLVGEGEGLGLGLAERLSVGLGGADASSGEDGGAAEPGDGTADSPSVGTGAGDTADPHAATTSARTTTRLRNAATSAPRAAMMRAGCSPRSQHSAVGANTDQPQDDWLLGVPWDTAGLASALGRSMRPWHPALGCSFASRSRHAARRQPTRASVTSRPIDSK